MHILASLISLMVLALALGVIVWMVRMQSAQIVAALLGRSPVALDSVTFLKPGHRTAPVQRRPSAPPAPNWEPMPLAA